MKIQIFTLSDFCYTLKSWMVPMAVYIAQIISTHWMPFLMPKMTSLTSENIINQKR